MHHVIEYAPDKNWGISKDVPQVIFSNCLTLHQQIMFVRGALGQCISQCISKYMSQELVDT